MDRPLLVLFDGHALVHRAFHALPPLSVSKTGEPTGAVYGFVLMLLKVIHDLKPTHWAIAFDRPTPTFRHLEFDEYKAQRPKAPDELVRQFGRVREVVDAFKMPAFEVDGYEADDVLGTIARRASAQDMDTIIVTGDNDELQLVSPRVKVLLPQRGFAESSLYDVAAVNAKYGVSPGQVADLKGLKGDPSDNIPGVPGVGDKTAARLIQEFGTVEAVYQRLDDVAPPKLRETLRAGETQARQGKRLATIITDVPVDFDPARCTVGGYDRPRLLQLLRELEFFRVLDRLPELGNGQPAAAPDPPQGGPEYQLVEAAPDLHQVVEALAGSTALVIHPVVQRAGRGQTELIGLALWVPQGRTCYVPLRRGPSMWSRGLDPEQALGLLRPLLSAAQPARWAHDTKEVITCLLDHGIGPVSLDFDTMIAAYLLGEKALDLRTLAMSRLGVELASSAELIAPKRGLAAGEDLPGLPGVACAEAAAVGRLQPLLKEAMAGQGLLKLFTEVEMPLVPVLARMERNGVALDVDHFRAMSQNLGRQLLELERLIYGFAGHPFNINSPQQLGTVLFSELKLPGGRKTKTGYSTEASVLEGLAGSVPIVKLVLEYRQLAKLKSTYIDALPVLVDRRTGRVHTSFNQTVAATGRLSSSDPNLQNIPIRGELGNQVRRAFVAAPGCLLVSADYSQIELRVLAHLSRDAGLLTAFQEDKDIHAATAAEVFGVSLAEVTSDMRRIAKVVNFGVAYGMSDYGLEQATELSREQASKFIASYFQRYPRVKDYIEATKRQARDRGYVETLLGRRRYIPEMHSPNRQLREAAERMAINMPVQGTAADIIKVAMVDLQRALDRDGMMCRMILQVHDELLLEAPQGEVERARRLVEEKMSQAAALAVPLKVDVKVGPNWAEMN
ncbi:MAG: DNA polymerase I [Chloroflexi bacterium]|nr:DNA polymerase I [Chloroflexota bacterium]